MTKESAVSAIKEMPQEFEVDELIEKLIFVAQVEEGLKEIEQGKKISLEDAKQIAQGWHK